MKIAVCSMFSDSEFYYNHYIGHIDKYFSRWTNQDILYKSNCEIDFYLVEGNSKDNTYEKLNYFKNEEIVKNINLYKFDCYIPDRIEKGSTVANFALDKITKNKYDYVIWAESDLIIYEDTISRLIEKIPNSDLFIISPIIMIKHPGLIQPYQFYDIWGYKYLDGRNWLPNEKPEDKVVEVSSLGSLCLMPAKLITEHNINFGKNGFHEFCESARKIGTRLFVDKSNVIYHPGDRINGRWV